MTFKEYAELAQRTASTKTKEEKIGHGILGLIGEAGEIVDIIKKWKYMNLPIDTVNEKLMDEAGDWLWYLIEYCTGNGFDIEYIMSKSIGEIDYLIDDIEEAAVTLVGFAADTHLQYYPDCWDEQKDEVNDVIDMCIVFNMLLRYASLDINDVMQHNIDKLSKRYPEHKFDADRSNRRYEHDTDG